MKKFGFILTLAAILPTSLAGIEAAAAEEVQAASAGAPVAATIGRMIYSADGKKLAAIYKVDANGAAQVLVDGKMLTIPAATLSEADGKVSTTLTKKQLFSS